jgi:hypothetical protein
MTIRISKFYYCTHETPESGDNNSNRCFRELKEETLNVIGVKTLYPLPNLEPLSWRMPLPRLPRIGSEKSCP